MAGVSADLPPRLLDLLSYRMFVWFLSDVMATSKVILGWVPTCHNEHSWRLCSSGGGGGGGSGSSGGGSGGGLWWWWWW